MQFVISMKVCYICQLDDEKYFNEWKVNPTYSRAYQVVANDAVARKRTIANTEQCWKKIRKSNEAIDKSERREKLLFSSHSFVIFLEQTNS